MAAPKKEHFSLPARGTPDAALLQQMEAWQEQDEARWRGGKVTGAVYYAGEDHKRHVAMMNKAMGMFSISNPLHASVWPSVVKMEAEVVAMTAALVGGGPTGDPGVVGTMSSGGTESIFIAIKAHRQWAEKEKGVTAPELVCCTSAHAAVDKACDTLRIKQVFTNPTGDFKADVEAMERLITKNTIMMYSSAPNYPNGMIDPIERLAEVARRRGIGLHVDCCLGGFFLPFAKRLRPGTIPPFDFSVPGVTSMSCDTHKYGYSVKGTSVCLFRSRDLRNHAYYLTPEWTGGKYITATPAGSRPGGPSAATWTSMMRLGDAGFMDAVRQILDASYAFTEGVRQIPGLYVLGDPKAMVIAVGSDELDIYAVGAATSLRGFGLAQCQNPPCIHLCTTLQHAPIIPAMLAALRSATEEVRAKKAKAELEVYGEAGSGGKKAKYPPRSVAVALRGFVDRVLDMPAAPAAAKM